MGRDWPANAVEVPLDRVHKQPVDVVVVQEPDQIQLAGHLLGGRRIPMIYLEHNTPKGDVPSTRHPVGDRNDIPLVHVTHFNDLMWDSGLAPTTVIEHGIVDPGERYTGELARAGVVINEPVRRGRVTGTDLLPAFAAKVPLDIFGMGLNGLDDCRGRLQSHGDLPTGRLHGELARRRVYLHTTRWTSLGLSLIEAMHLGMPVIALATTEALRAVPADAGLVSTDVDELADGLHWLASEPESARRIGKQAREYALANYGLARFLREWDELLMEVSS
jgi:hypothetical protein